MKITAQGLMTKPPPPFSHLSGEEEQRTDLRLAEDGPKACSAADYRLSVEPATEGDPMCSNWVWWCRDPV
ncbi:unnamed protein product [Arctogadus glacialis]